ncbi:putative ankyrin repeat protein RF_0381 isoform X2 [Haliotis asinina]|uniref:putative ankyrin repeat protein RF_0381 isoform X2 n=1 Tax=Haliotis asinina TaxID=109174 RepID=UPI0035319489
MFLVVIVIILSSVTAFSDAECNIRSFGELCDKSCPSQCAVPLNRLDRFCDLSSGICPEGCIRGWHGNYCNQTCNTSCLGSVCNQQNGHCTLGCIDNYVGPFCDTVPGTTTVTPEEDTTSVGTESNEPTKTTTTEPPSDKSVLAISVAVAVTVGVVIFIAVIICLRHEKKGHPDPEVGQRLLPVSAANLDGSRRKDTMLHSACRRGTLAQVRQILSHELVDTNSRGEYGWTPVMIAAEGGRRKLVDLLVKRGGDLSLTDDDGYTVLHVVSIKGHLKVVRYVLSKKVVGVNTTGHCERTAVMAAARFGHRKVFDLLVKNGSDLTTVDSDGNNILHIACIGGNVEIVKHILSNVNVDINSRGLNGKTPLMFAINFGHVQVFELLVSKGCILPIVEENGKNILHMACVKGNVDMVRHILNKSIVSVDGEDSMGKTPVMLAVESGHTDVFQLLVSKQCDIHKTCHDGNNILHTSCSRCHVDIVKHIVTGHLINIDSCGQNRMTPVMFAAKNGQRDIFDLLVNNGCDMSQKDKDGNTVLHMACIGGSKYIVERILSKEPVDVNSRGQSQSTPAMMAAACGHKDVFDLLVNRGADLTLVDGRGFGVHHLACMGGHLPVVEHIQNIIGVRDSDVL